jgi:hypothetical protein
MNKKGTNTTVVAIVFGVIVLGLTLAWVFNYIEFQNYERALVALSPIAIMAIGWFAKDQNKSHTGNK